MHDEITLVAGIRDVLFTCTRYNPEPSPIDISEVPLSIIPIIERTEVCTTSDASDNVVIWYVALNYIWCYCLKEVATEHVYTHQESTYTEPANITHQSKDCI